MTASIMCCWLELGTGSVLLGEVPMCNDDKTDNRFYQKLGRFPTIEEDEAPYRYLCTEYPKAKTIFSQPLICFDYF